jgi:hypothetical protein
MITLSSIIYEGNFDTFLSDDCWFMKFKSPLITNKIIVVNNLTSKELFLAKVNDLLTRHDFEVIYVNEIKDIVINKYKLGINESTHGYYYTIPYFCLFEKVKTKYVFNVASDCMSDIKISETFLNLSVNELETNNRCSTTMVAWVKNNRIMSNNLTVGQSENIETFKQLCLNYIESENFNYTFGFTDQFFIGDVERLRNTDFNIPTHISEQIYHGPDYYIHSGNLH